MKKQGLETTFALESIGLHFFAHPSKHGNTIALLNNDSIVAYYDL